MRIAVVWSRVRMGVRMVSGIVGGDVVHKRWGIVAMGRVSVGGVRIDRVGRSWLGGIGGRRSGYYGEGGGGGVEVGWRWGRGEYRRAGGAVGGGGVGLMVG